jgi:signal transduction histidine kinase
LEFNPMKFSEIRRRPLILGMLACLLLIIGAVALRGYLRSPARGLPYRDSFAKGKADEWQALGGTWELMGGAIRNDSDERGAKLLTGSPFWQNYSVEADLFLLGISGDAGLIIRSSNEEEGVNTYSGYYAGVRTMNSQFVLGRSDHGWMEVNKNEPVPGAIHPFQWYHLKLLAFNCQIVASLTSPSLTSPFSLGINDQDCLRSGRIGLRSYSSGGIWRNVVVRPATRGDLDNILLGTGTHDDSEPKNSAVPDPRFEPLVPQPEKDKVLVGSNSNVQSIASLRLTSFAAPTNATVRGVVVLTEPGLFVQDSTGGVYVPQPNAPLLKVGDEVEVSGTVHSGDFSSRMEHATVRLLWAHTPMPPISVTASQASTGKFDATFIEVQGRLVGKEQGPGNTLILDLDEGSQSFRAILNPGRSGYLFNNLKLDSRLRLRGICVVDPSFTSNLTSFVVLLPSNEDLNVITGPPWWSTGHVIAIIVASLLLALIAVSLYHRVEHWRLRAILQERERLAHEMHDTLAQSFAGIGFQLQAIRNGLNEEGPLQQQLELASNLVRHSHEEARRSIATLRSEDMESEDLLSALEQSARRMIEGGSVQLVSEREGVQRAIPLRIADTLYRIGQEAVANAVRHAHPSIIKIRLTYREDSVCLQIEDDGAGFLPGNDLQGFGIRGMRRRAQSISAAFQLSSEPHCGARIQVTATLPPRATFFSWPKLLLRYIKEYWTDAGATRHSDSHPYRG